MWFKKLSLGVIVFFVAISIFSSRINECNASSDIIGYHDESNCDIGASGWAKDLNSSKPLRLGIWLNWPANSVLTKKIGEVTADLLRIDLPFSDQYHGFKWYLPKEFKDGNHRLYVYALNEEGEPQKLLNRSGREIFCGGKLLSKGSYIQVKRTGLKVYSGPGFNYYPVRRIWKLRAGVILKINREVIFDKEGRPWYGVTADIWNRYGSGKWFIPAASECIKEIVFQDEIIIFSNTIKKWIEIDLSDQTLRAIERNKEGEDKIALETLVSTGAYGTVTRKGVFRIYSFRIHSYMKGWDYDLPGVPFDMYFDGLKAIHGAYWHNSFGSVRSHGCVNVPLDNAEWLWFWVNRAPLQVVVKQ